MTEQDFEMQNLRRKLKHKNEEILMLSGLIEMLCEHNAICGICERLEDETCKPGHPTCRPKWRKPECLANR